MLLGALAGSLDGLVQFTVQRWDVVAYEEAVDNAKEYGVSTKHSAFIEGGDLFDAGAFGMQAAEVPVANP